MADETAFEVDGNIATAPRDVVFRDRTMELIQFWSTTDQVQETPIFPFPPWINGSYLLELKLTNSLIKWSANQGYRLFVVSWVNPDGCYTDVGLEYYIEDGYLAAIDEAKAICGVKQVNAVG